jgi:hypothetical protein
VSHRDYKRGKPLVLPTTHMENKSNMSSDHVTKSIEDLTQAGELAITTGPTNLKLNLDAWTKKNVPAHLQEPFSQLGADSVDDLRFIKNKDLDSIGMPTLKKRKLFKQIVMDAGGKLTSHHLLDRVAQ